MWDPFYVILKPYHKEIIYRDLMYITYLCRIAPASFQLNQSYIDMIAESSRVPANLHVATNAGLQLKREISRLFNELPVNVVKTHKCH